MTPIWSRNLAGFRLKPLDQLTMAGADGIEPPMRESKSRALTAWRYPRKEVQTNVLRQISALYTDPKNTERLFFTL